MNKTAKVALWIGVIIALVFGGPIAYVKLKAAREEAQFQEQLRLAWSEGLPSTSEQFKSFIKPARPEENAAPLYRKLIKLKRLKNEPNKVCDQFLFERSPAHSLAARNALTDGAPYLTIIEEAVKLPDCWFDRDWAQGFALLFVEFSYMKSGARLLALRAAVKAGNGEHRAALADINRIFKMATHLAEEPSALAQLVSIAHYEISLRCLRGLSFVHRDRHEYLEAARQAVAAWPKVNLRVEQRAYLWEFLSVIELCRTPEGRENLGLREDEISPAERIMPILLSRSKAKIEIAKGAREFWAAHALPLKEKLAAQQEADRKVWQAMLAFPTAALILEKLTDPGVVTERREESWEARRLQNVAMLRALGFKTIPKAVKTSDLLSPFDGKPVTYSWDGKQIKITVSGLNGDSGPIVLRMPPNLESGN